MQSVATVTITIAAVCLQSAWITSQFYGCCGRYVAQCVWNGNRALSASAQRLCCLCYCIHRAYSPACSRNRIFGKGSQEQKIGTWLRWSLLCHLTTTGDWEFGKTKVQHNGTVKCAVVLHFRFPAFSVDFCWLPNNCEWQEAQLSPSDRAMRLVSSNLANCHATVQKLLIRQVLAKLMVWSWRFSWRQCVMNNVHSTMTRPRRLPLSQVS